MRLILLIAMLILVSCSKTSKQEQDYLFEEVEVSLNEKNYDHAIFLLLKMPKSEKVKELLSSAFAGRAGFNAAQLYDMIETNQDPIRILYLLANKFSNQNISDSQLALAEIYSAIPKDAAGNSSDLKYASIQVYKISQILVKNFMRHSGSYANDLWTPCDEAELLGMDLREIIISVNRAILATKNIESAVYEYLLALQKELKIQPDLFEPDTIKNTDLSHIRLAIDKEYYNYVGKSYEDQNLRCASVTVK